ncbi:MAG: Fic family protein [Betaproteobacteria bacterium]|nr:Fic family protein [Betaproteobacteria bacterium]
MVPSVLSSTHEAVLKAVAQSAAGANIEQIEAQLPQPPTRRTLQRWLNALVGQGRLRKEGQARSTRYLLPVQAAPEAADAAPGDVFFPLSDEARAIDIAVRQPVQHRTPVGYRRSFLDSYRPNTTFYLHPALRAELQALGQVAAHNEPAGTYARSIANRLLIDLSWNSSRLEGNTYSLLETERLLSAGDAAEGKGALEAQMILNHKAAIEFLMDCTPDMGFNRYTLLNLHALLSDNLLPDPTASGRLRTVAVGIGQAVFLPLEGPQLIAECFAQVLDTAAAIQDPLEQAFFAMVHLPYLQPFEDVNKRVSRLAANIPLIQHNLCPLSFVDVPPAAYISAMLGVYELNRIELLRDVFAWAYKRSCARYSAVRQSLGEPDPFRLRYRALIFDTVAEVVRAAMNKQRAIAFVARQARQHLPPADQHRFVEVTETELMSLHEGNMARYRLRPSEFEAWRQGWR